MYRAARPGATIFVADMHPETEATCGWKRTFRVETTRTADADTPVGPAGSPTGVHSMRFEDNFTE